MGIFLFLQGSSLILPVDGVPSQKDFPTSPLQWCEMAHLAPRQNASRFTPQAIRTSLAQLQDPGTAPGPGSVSLAWHACTASPDQGPFQKLARWMVEEGNPTQIGREVPRGRGGAASPEKRANTEGNLNAGPAIYQPLYISSFWGQGHLVSCFEHLDMRAEYPSFKCKACTLRETVVQYYLCYIDQIVD